MNAIPQINIGTNPMCFMHVSQLIALPSDTPFGNLSLKHIKLIQRLDRVNQLVQAAYASYWSINPYTPSSNTLDHQLLGEEIVYWLRKTADEIICLFYLFHIKSQSGSFPNEITVDSIGRLQACKDEKFVAYFSPHQKFFDDLNEISNAFKHSFINSDLTLMGRFEPFVFALSLKYNALKNDAKFHQVPLSYLIGSFDTFHSATKERLLEIAKVEQVGSAVPQQPAG
jgi:hypothetical protein